MTKRIPGATYRLQFNRDFTFTQACELVGYLHELGITDLYASPLFKACPQSTHGYDVCDFNQLNPNLGTREDFERLIGSLRKQNMGLLLDMVPNHMSTSTSNDWWFDVLENGPASKYATWFDIDWRRFEGKVLLPILEDDLEPVLVAGKLRLVFDAQKFFIAYHDRHFPLSQESRAVISKQSAQGSIEAALKHFNGIPSQAASFGPLRDLLNEQHYRLAFWRTGPREINYRRFFDVNELISLRIELPEVFEAAHGLLSLLLNEQKVNGLRIDHPDGLWDPRQYLDRLQEKFESIYTVAEKILTDDEMLPGDWPTDGSTGYDFLNRLNGLFVNPNHEAAFDRIYSEFTGCDHDFREIVYETKKHILQSSFPSELNAVTRRLEAIADLVRPDQRFELNELREALTEVLACFSVYRTYVTEETTELSAAEREYVEQSIRQAHQRLLMRANQSMFVSAGGRQSSPAGEEPVPDALRLIHDLLALRMPDRLDNSSRRHCREFVMRFQQLSGPLMAKGLEDTTFYNFNRLISLNEVGGNPSSFGNSVHAFHQHNLRKAARWPHSLLATATHDTKRGEDLRARINVLSEMPDEWRAALERWRKLNAGKKITVDGEPAPASNDEYFFYQTMIGAWPSGEFQDASFCQRMVDCMLKSIKESKANTSWIEPNPAYEAATRKFIEQALAGAGAATFLSDFKTFQRRAAFFGQLNSLSQTLLKVTAPGVPDFYQGAELWDLNLVDPDNRRAVDYEIRRKLLSDLKARSAQNSPSQAPFLTELLHDDNLGQSKLYLIWRVLEFRNRHRALFDNGAYVPLTAIGSRKEHICAFARIWKNEVAIATVPRLVVGMTRTGAESPPLSEIWEDTALLLPESSALRGFRNILTDETLEVSPGAPGRLPIGSILAKFPVGLIAAQSGGSSSPETR